MEFYSTLKKKKKKKPSFPDEVTAAIKLTLVEGVCNVTILATSAADVI